MQLYYIVSAVQLLTEQEERCILGYCAVAFLADTRGMCTIIPQKSFFAYNRFSTLRFSF
jgi:hypothetical protein